ncbi:hypothetical protein F8388_019861 [Cannabis sativa]|uniref:Uncharacterized protein n=1 Tax=Cannabis sativa TaxID=3483 RepID=A0A7J6H4K3_CANSA|nr:hypothetical protein F8388_019861 [Cannabis sativa]
MDVHQARLEELELIDERREKPKIICCNTNDVYLGHMTNLYDQGRSKKGVALETQDTIFSNSLTIKSNMSLKLRIQTGATVAQEYSVE